jgi:histidinol-phosphate/aromatic aminotransferase/cobyric acid decarboxylase-like protein
MATNEDSNETTAARRARITKDCDANMAIHHAEGVLWSCHGLAEMLVQDTVRDNQEWVMAVGNAIIEQTERMIEFLDRPGGWDRPAPDLTAEEARDGLHAETVREIRRQYPDADDREHKLRVAIRESVGMTAHEEQRAYELISAALRS